MMENEFIVAMVTSIIVGIVSGGLGSYVAVKVLTNEIKWINRILEKHDGEIDRLHDRLSSHVTHMHGENHGA